MVNMKNENSGVPEERGNPPWLLTTIGKWFSGLFFKNRNHRLFLFSSPNDDNAVTDVADIARLFEDMNPVIIQTGPYRPKGFDTSGESSPVEVFDLSKKMKNIFLRALYSGAISKWVNRSGHCVVIGEENQVFYDLLPFFAKSVKTIDLVHSEKWQVVSKHFFGKTTATIFSSEKMAKDAVRLYQGTKKDSGIEKKFVYVDHTLPAPAEPVFTGNEQLEVVFISKGIPDERVHLVASIAEILHKKGIAIRISIIGEVNEQIQQSSLPYCTFYGSVEDGKKVRTILHESDVLIVTTKTDALLRESLEIMAMGKVIIAIENNTIQSYVSDGVNGYLIKDYEKESNIVDDFHIALSVLAADREHLVKMGERNWQDARERFSEERFRKKWKAVIE